MSELRPADNLLKRAARALATRAGLVSRTRADELGHALERARLRISVLKQRVEQANGDAIEWRKRATFAAERVAALTRQVEALGAKPIGVKRARAQRIGAGGDTSDAPAPAGVAAARATEDRQESEGISLAELRDKARWSEAALRLAREQLMAIEVKLDIIEGAVTVLDERTRAALAAGTPADEPDPMNSRRVG